MAFGIVKFEHSHLFVHTERHKKVKINKPANKILITDSFGSTQFINLLIVIIILIISLCYEPLFGL